jgi:hypothetical protein
MVLKDIKSLVHICLHLSKKSHAWIIRKLDNVPTGNQEFTVDGFHLLFSVRKMGSVLICISSLNAMKM